MCGVAWPALGTVNGAEILQQTTLGRDWGAGLTKYDIEIQRRV